MVPLFFLLILFIVVKVKISSMATCKWEISAHCQSNKKLLCWLITCPLTFSVILQNDKLFRKYTFPWISLSSDFFRFWTFIFRLELYQHEFPIHSCTRGQLFPTNDLCLRRGLTVDYIELSFVRTFHVVSYLIPKKVSMLSCWQTSQKFLLLSRKTIRKLM